jgi:hypothetical protein
MALNAFFSYFGGKSSLARYYPPPAHDTVIEPFAGAAGYATRYHRKRVILVEKDTRVAALWRYLIRVSARELLALPDLAEGGKVSDLRVSDEARLLIGYNVQFSASGGPRNSLTTWSKGSASMWGPVLRARLAAQVEKIRHWRLIEGDYTCAPDVEATWHIDPPYEKMGAYYRCGAKSIDFRALGRWCRARKGQVMVCENAGARWLPFRAFKSNAPSSNKAASAEVIWTNDG